MKEEIKEFILSVIITGIVIGVTILAIAICLVLLQETYCWNNLCAIATAYNTTR